CCKKVAERELCETPENVKQSMRELRELLAADTSMYYDTNEDFLRIFLRPCKYNAKEAYNLMKHIADYRSRYRDTFYDLLPEQEKSSIVDNNVVNVLTNRDQFGRRILVINGGASWDTSKVTNDQLLRCLYIIQLGAILEPETQVHGVVIIFDLKGMGMSQVRQFTPAFAMKLISFIQDAMPLRFKGLHVINNPFIWNIAWKILYPLQNKKVRARTHTHGSDVTGMHKFIHPNYLPQDWGGNLKKVNYGGKEWYPCIEGYTDFIKRWNSFGNVNK
ncbi:hypothetical protein Trydic_g595, partial [Trypoxylus dichotomus]